MIWIFALAQDLGPLIEQLDDESPRVRDAAMEAIAKEGERAIPDLELALSRRSPEIRTRADYLLRRFPDYVLRNLPAHPDFAPVKRLWNAIFDGVIDKRPIPKIVWKEFAPQMALLELSGPHTPEWILSDLQRQGTVALNELAMTCGVEDTDVRFEMCARKVMDVFPRDFIGRLSKLRPDAATFEEIYITILRLHDRGLISFDDRDWDTALYLLVRARRRPDSPDLSLPSTKEQALAIAAKGPMIRGTADALRRAAVNLKHEQRFQQVERLEILREPARMTDYLGSIYSSVLRLDERIGDRYYAPRMLKLTRETVRDEEVLRLLTDVEGDEALMRALREQVVASSRAKE